MKNNILTFLGEGVFMKKNILFIFILYLSTTGLGSAKALPPLVKVNCDDVKLSMLTVGKNDFRFYAYWNEPTTFPKPPIQKKIGKYDSNFVKTFRFICPNLEVSYDGNMAEIKSKDYQSILKNISEYDQYLDLYFYSFYKYPNIREGLITVDYAIGLKDFVIKSGIYLGFEGDNLDNISYTSNITKNTIIGYKVDNRELKPLLYDRKISRYKDDFDNASIIDIYHKVSKDEFGIGPNIQRIYINKVNGIMRIYQKYPFPSS